MFLYNNFEPAIDISIIKYEYYIFVIQLKFLERFIF